MRVRPTALVILAALALGAPAFATEPGAPLDCSDLELAPGLTCSEFSTPNEEGFSTFFLRSAFVAIDNDGRIIQNGIGDVVEGLGPCGERPLSRLGLVLTVGAGGVRTPLVSVRERCLDPGDELVDTMRADQLVFDAVRGALFVGVSSFCSNGSACGYEGGSWIAHIDGFTPLADVLPPPPPPQPLCRNGLDDDADGRVDAADGNCKSDADNDESRP